jgi:hypothetical protein
MTNSVPKNTAQNTRRSAGGTVDAQFSGSNPVKRDGQVREPGEQ